MDRLKNEEVRRRAGRERESACDRFGICTCKFKMLSENQYYCDYW